MLEIGRNLVNLLGNLLVRVTSLLYSSSQTSSFMQLCRWITVVSVIFQPLIQPVVLCAILQLNDLPFQHKASIIGLGFCKIHFSIKTTSGPVWVIYVLFVFLQYLTSTCLTDESYSLENTILSSSMTQICVFGLVGEPMEMHTPYRKAPGPPGDSNPCSSQWEIKLLPGVLSNLDIWQL